jgi:biopolymer transport protein ExbD
MAMTIGCSEGKECADINMTPLIDVMLVLLIIFIITIPRQTHSITIDNPSARTQLSEPRVIDLSIDFDGTVLWNKQTIGRDVLEKYIRLEAASSPQPEIHIRVDKFAKYEIVAQTLAELQRQGLKQIGFVNADDI